MYRGYLVSLLHGKPIETGNTAPRVSLMIPERRSVICFDRVTVAQFQQAPFIFQNRIEKTC